MGLGCSWCHAPTGSGLLLYWVLAFDVCFGQACCACSRVGGHVDGAAVFLSEASMYSAFVPPAGSDPRSHCILYAVAIGIRHHR